MKTKDYKTEILEFIAKEPGKSFRQLRFMLELNEGTLNRALINLIKLELIEKRGNKTYFKK